ncbi:MAG: GAF domain-containing protein [Saprospiraceae bacterium]|nr:GAF domain-containing protein [Saprospiraceae bacterium]
MQSTHSHHLSKSADDRYLPLQDFQDYSKNIPPSPYTSRFSFSKLIKTLQARSESSHETVLEATIDRLKAAELRLQQNTTVEESAHLQEEVHAVMQLIFPAFFLEGQMGYIKGPFESYPFRFRTEDFDSQLGNYECDIKLSNQNLSSPHSPNILLAGAAVLNTFYGQQVEMFVGEGMTLRERETKMERHYKFDVHLDYLEVKKVKPLKKLDQEQIHRLLNNLNDHQLWLEYITPENFVFEGLVIGYISDVTKPEILSKMKEMAANEGGKSDHEEDRDYLEILARSYLEMPEILLGSLQTVDGPWIESLTWSLLRYYDAALVRPSLKDAESSYGQVLLEGKPVIIVDLPKKKHLSPLESALIQKGIRSLLLAPIFDDDGRIISIFELASPQPYRFSQLITIQLEEFISLFAMGTNKFINEMENAVRLTMQQEFTSIHPSVAWKFREVASKYFWERVVEEKQVGLDTIVFKDVYPLYGQADIVGSSKLRNESISKDLIDNLERVNQLLIQCSSSIHFHLFNIYAEEVQSHCERLKEGSFVSSDESRIVELLTEQIHPVIRKLMPSFSQKSMELAEAYFDYLDPNLDIVYRQRKAYEDSVTLVNETISHYLMQEEEKMQKTLPHFFEKFQTDGVEYNLYLGQSILEKDEFHSFYLQNFRLWQLIVMCGITRLVEIEAKKFPVYLQTAQLIFVYNNTLSIRFQMDEKQFDIDGAYNVRYEILKKRIDKAYIKGTDERLTQKGKIAIVWLQDKDRQEYQQYLDHLVRNHYIDAEIEDLELDKMQGVEGLKAMRITVLPEQ